MAFINWSPFRDILSAVFLLEIAILPVNDLQFEDTPPHRVSQTLQAV